MAVILGIDPGSRITGFGIIKTSLQSIHYVTCGCIRTQVDDHTQRLKVIFNELSSIIKRYEPTTAAIEKVFMCHSVDSALKLGQAKGVAMLTAGMADLDVTEYSARQVKQSVVGYGAADKSQVQHMVKTLLELQKEPAEDAADALAVAMCHHQTQFGLQGTHAKKTVRRRWR